MRRALLVAALLGALPAAAARAADFGTVELVEGQVTLQMQDGRVVVPRVGDVVPAGAEMATGKTGELHVATADSGFVALRPNTRVRVAEYRAEGDELDTQILALMRGTFRSITGWIGRHNRDRYKVTTPNATIGVRGTDHEPGYVDGDDAAAVGVEPGTYDKVNEGTSVLETDGGRVDVGHGAAGFAPKSRAKPARLKRVPGFFKGTRHDRHIGEKRGQLKKVLELRRAEKRAQMKQRLERQKERRAKRRERRDRD